MNKQTPGDTLRVVESIGKTNAVLCFYLNIVIVQFISSNNEYHDIFISIKMK